MKDEYSELNDIILNRHDKSGTRKKMLIGVGTLAIVAIVIVIIMGRISGSSPTNLPQPMLPSEHPTALTETTEAADVVAVPADQPTDSAVEKPAESTAAQPVPIAQSEVVVIDETAEAPAAPEPMPTVQQPKTTVTPAPVKQESVAVPAPAVKAPVTAGSVYIQVGSFTRYKPNDSFLAAIKRSGYDYTFHRVVVSGNIINKVLVGPFKDRNDAAAHLPDVRRKIESGAFIYTIKP